LDRLRDGVEQAIKALGGGFLAHPANAQLREKLRSGALSKQDYYRQLLRLIYRQLFLFVAEDRDLLYDPKANPEARERYTHYYSTARLRRLAAGHRGTKHGDLYRSLRLVMEKLGSNEGCPPLALPALGSFLWSETAIPDLVRCDISNRDFLDALRALAFTLDNKVLRSVGYKNLGSEELGSIYESLLELHPELNVDAGTFNLTTAGGHERKTTGSYYTPTSLIQCLLDSALDPVLAEAARKPNTEAAILDLKVCDPACGSGHFLVAAAHRIARRLAAIRTGDDAPSPEATRPALRDVISHCIYGVDVNPMAVELCKVSLWMEAIEPGKPLTFLDHHIQCGNSLLGTTPALLAQGIPDTAFMPIEGDDKAVVSALRKRNRAEREGQMTFTAIAEASIPYSNLAGSLASLDTIDDTSITGVHDKEERYARLAASVEYRKAQLIANAWCTAFVWEKSKNTPEPVTHDVFCHLLTEPERVPTTTRVEITCLAEQYKFFHWYIEFPDVFRIPADGEVPENEQTGWSGGFDVLLGNPPWERIKLQEKEWFATRRPDIAMAPNAVTRRRLISSLTTEDPALYAAFIEACRQAEGESHLVRNSGRYPLCGRGDINTYAIFAETNRMLIAPTGHVGCIVPSGIATDDTTKYFFQNLMETQALRSLYDFENRAGLFPAVDSRMKFCLLTLVGPARSATHGAEFVFFAHAVEDLKDPERCFTLSAEDVALLNPATRTCPSFRSRRDAELAKAIYHCFAPLGEAEAASEEQWHLRIPQGLFHQTNDAPLLLEKTQLEEEGFSQQPNGHWIRGTERFLTMCEGRMIHIFNHRASSVGISDTNTFRSGVSIDVTEANLADPMFVATPRYWVSAAETETRIPQSYQSDWFSGFKDVTSATNERTMIAAAMPRTAVVYSIRVIFALGHAPADTACLFASFNSFCFDYFARNKTPGNHITDYIVRQLPVLPPAAYGQSCRWSGSTQKLRDWLLSYVLELTYTAWDLEPFAKDCGYAGPPFRWDAERRFLLRCELDAAYFHLYGIARDDVDYIMETFPIVKRNDMKRFGDFRTKLMNLDIYDQMQQAMDRGEPYQTLLEPPPADPRVAHPPRTEG
jgi:hypothetical protein